MGVYIEKKNNNFVIISKYFLPNINLIFEYSVPDNIRLDCKVYPYHPHTNAFYMYYQLTTEANNYSLIYQSFFIWW